MGDLALQASSSRSHEGNNKFNEGLGYPPVSLRLLKIFHVLYCFQIDDVCFLFPSMQLALELLYLYVLAMFIAYLPTFAFSFNQ